MKLFDNIFDLSIANRDHTWGFWVAMHSAGGEVNVSKIDASERGDGGDGLKSFIHPKTFLKRDSLKTMDLMRLQRELREDREAGVVFKMIEIWPVVGCSVMRIRCR